MKLSLALCASQVAAVRVGPAAEWHFSEKANMTAVVDFRDLKILQTEAALKTEETRAALETEAAKKLIQGSEWDRKLNSPNKWERKLRRINKLVHEADLANLKHIQPNKNDDPLTSIPLALTIEPKKVRGSRKNLFQKAKTSFFSKKPTTQ